MVFGLIKRAMLKDQSTNNIRISYLSDWYDFKDCEISKSIFIVAIKPGFKLIHKQISWENDGSQKIGISGGYISHNNPQHPIYKSIAIENSSGKMECVSFPSVGDNQTLAIFLNNIENPTAINRNHDVVFMGAVLNTNHQNDPKFDNYYRVGLGYVNRYFSVSYDREVIDRNIKRSIETEEREKKEKKEAEAKKILDERIRKEKETKDKAEKEEKERKEKRDKEDKLRLEEHERKQEELRVKALEEQERLYKLRMEEETKAQIARIESETKAFEKRKQIEFEELERVTELKKHAMEEEARLTAEILKRREELERLETEANQKTIEQLLNILKSGG